MAIISVLDVIKQVENLVKNEPKQPSMGYIKAKKTQLRYLYYEIFIEGIFPIEVGNKIGLFTNGEGEAFLKNAASQIKYESLYSRERLDEIKNDIVKYINEFLLWSNQKEKLLESINAKMYLTPNENDRLFWVIESKTKEFEKYTFPLRPY